MALNVETYQHSKKNCGGGNNSGVNQEILDRLDKLENSQNHLYNEFIEDFKTTKYIDEYKTTAVVSSNGLIASQFRNDIKELLDDDSMVDWANSRDLIIENGCARIAYNNLQNAIFVSNYFATPNLRGFRFDFAEKHFRVPTASGVNNVSPLNQTWLVSEVDNSGRLWVLDSNCHTSISQVEIFLTIYDKDLSIVRSRSKVGGITPITGVGSNFHDVHYLGLTAEIGFDEVNNACLIINTKGTSNLAADTDQHGGTSNCLYYIYATAWSIDRNGDNAKYIRAYSCAHASTNSRGFTFNVANKPYFVGDKLIIEWPRQSMGYINGAWSATQYKERYDILKYDIENRTFSSSKAYETGARLGAWPNNGWYRMCPGKTTFYNDKKRGVLTEFFAGDVISSDYCYGFYKRDFNYKDTVGDVSDYTVIATNHNDLHKMSKGFHSGRLNTMIVSEEDGHLYVFTPNTNGDRHTVINFYKYSFTTSTINLVSSKTIDLNTVSSPIHFQCDSNCKVIEHQGDFHILFLGKDADRASNSLKYICIDKNGDIKIPATLVHCADKTNGDVYRYNLHAVGNSIVFVYNETGFSSMTNTSNVRMSFLELQNTSIQYEYFNTNDAKWYRVIPGQRVELNTPVDKIKLKSTFNSPNTATSPELHQINLQYWTNENDSVAESEFHSLRIPGIENSGRAVITADADNRDGTIKYFVSYDAGLTFHEVRLGEEFSYNVIDTPDFRIKIEMTVKNGSDAPPVVRSYNITSNHVVMHSDLERVQINLIKTNFKIDTLTKAGTNGLNKMIIDTLNDTGFIDDSKSDYTHSVATGEIAGNYIQTKQMSTNGIIKYILLTTDEILNNNPNCKIEYFISTDNGKTFDKITPEVKSRVNSQNAVDDNIVLRAVMYEGAKLSAWGWAWD